MSDFSHLCGTASCIAGWAAAIAFGEENIDEALAKGEGNNNGVYITAKEWLGLDPETADRLFMPDELSWNSIRPKQAASVLRNLAVTGQVDWSEVAQEQGEEQ